MQAVNHYKIVILPPEKYLGNLRRYRAAYPGTLLKANRILSRPHINLLSFSFPAGQEAGLHRQLATFLKQKKRFRVATYGFKGLPRNRLLFLEPQKNRLDYLRKEIVQVIQRCHGQAQEEFSSSDLAGTSGAVADSDDFFRETLRHFREIDFRFHFEVKSINVLTRPLKAWRPWKHCFELCLGS